MDAVPLLDGVSVTARCQSDASAVSAAADRQSSQEGFIASLLFCALMGIRALVLPAHKDGATVAECRARLRGVGGRAGAPRGRTESRRTVGAGDKMSGLERSKRLFNLEASGLLQSNRCI